LGADAAIAAGPVGRSAGVATDIEFAAAEFSYSRSRGLFAGVARDGAGIARDHQANAAFYGKPGITAQQVFDGSGNMAPAAANEFVQVLSGQTRGLPTLPAMSDAPAANTAADTAPKSVRTYGIGDPDAPDN